MSKHIRGTSTGADLLAAVDRAIAGEVTDELLAALQYIAMELSGCGMGENCKCYETQVEGYKDCSDRLVDFALAVLSKAEQAIAKAEKVICSECERPAPDGVCYSCSGADYLHE